MAHQEIYARVIAPLSLPDGCPLYPGQSLEPCEIVALGTERVGKLLEIGAIELRNRAAPQDGGILDCRLLKDAAERGEGELRAFDQALMRTVSAGDAVTPAVALPQRDQERGQSSPELGDGLRATACSVATLAEAHRQLRTEFDALAASVSQRRSTE